MQGGFWFVQNLICLFDRTTLGVFPHLDKAHCVRLFDPGPLMLSLPSWGFCQLWAETNSGDCRVLLECVLLSFTNRLYPGNGCCGSCNNDYNTSVEIQLLI